jgi:hypothetical protein
MLDQDRKRLAAKRNAPAHNGTRQAAQLEEQARHEHTLAGKVANAEVREMIRNSATGKAEMAAGLRGKPVDPKQSKYQVRHEISAWRNHRHK